MRQRCHAGVGNRIEPQRFPGVHFTLRVRTTVRCESKQIVLRLCCEDPTAGAQRDVVGALKQPLGRGVLCKLEQVRTKPQPRANLPFTILPAPGQFHRAIEPDRCSIYGGDAGTKLPCQSCGRGVVLICYRRRFCILEGRFDPPVHFSPRSNFMRRLHQTRDFHRAWFRDHFGEDVYRACNRWSLCGNQCQTLGPCRGQSAEEFGPLCPWRRTPKLHGTHTLPQDHTQFPTYIFEKVQFFPRPCRDRRKGLGVVSTTSRFGLARIGSGPLHGAGMFHEDAGSKWGSDCRKRDSSGASLLYAPK